MSAKEATKAFSLRAGPAIFSASLPGVGGRERKAVLLYPLNDKSPAFLWCIWEGSKLFPGEETDDPDYHRITGGGIVPGTDAKQAMLAAVAYMLETE